MSQEVYVKDAFLAPGNGSLFLVSLRAWLLSHNKYCTLLLLSYSGKLRDRCHKLDESNQSGDSGLPIIAEQITSINLDLAARALLFGFESFKSGRESRACIVCRPGISTQILGA